MFGDISFIVSISEFFKKYLHLLYIYLIKGNILTHFSCLFSLANIFILDLQREMFLAYFRCLVLHSLISRILLALYKNISCIEF